MAEPVLQGLMPKERNALTRAEIALAEGKLPTKADLDLLSELEVEEAYRILDKVDELKQQKLNQAELRKNIEASPQVNRVSPSSSSVDTGGLSPLDAGKSEGPPKKRVLTGREKDYYQFFDNRFGPFIVLILYFCLADLDKAVFYAPSPEECHELAPHLARMGPKVEDWFRAPKWLHDAIVTSDDTFTVGMVLVGYLDRIGVLEKLLPWFQGTARKVKNLNESKPETSTGSVQPGNNGAVPGPDTTRNFVPLDQLGVQGIGYQYEPNPGT
jgi:hypothetical protein